EANRAADAAIVEAGRSAPATAVPLRLEADGRTAPWVYRAFRATTSPSDISRATRVIFTQDPIDLTIPRDQELRVVKNVAAPAAYIVPAEWTEVIDRLDAHGIRTIRTSQAWEGQVETYRCGAPHWHPIPFEGRQVLFDPGEGGVKSGAALGACRVVREQLAFPAGSA